MTALDENVLDVLLSKDAPLGEWKKTADVQRILLSTPEAK